MPPDSYHWRLRQNMRSRTERVNQKLDWPNTVGKPVRASLVHLDEMPSSLSRGVQDGNTRLRKVCLGIRPLKGSID